MTRVRKRLSDELPGAMSQPVSNKGWMTAQGYQGENHAWMVYLTRRVEGRREGLDPKMIKPEILAAAGHPPRSASQRIKTYMTSMELERDPKRDRGLRRLRELCIECAVTATEVRRCACISCPLWAHRLGSNPHNWHKRHS
jgi:hypothetical protein